MAEILLGLAGAAVAGIPGLGVTALAGFQGGVILGSILFPASGPTLDQGRLDEIRIQNAQQASPISIVYGINRVAGTIVWATGITATEYSESVGGKGGGGSTVTGETYSTSLAVLVCEGPVTKIRRIWANEKVIYDWRTGVDPTVAGWIDPDKIRVYDGSQTTPDAAIEADKGAGNVPAFKGMCYVVFEDLQLAELGNNIPNFNFEVETDFADAEEMANDVAARIELQPGDYDFSALAAYPTRGLVIGARVEAGRVFEAIGKANWVDILETGGQLKATQRTGVPVLEIPPDHIGASADGEAPKAFVEVLRTKEVDLPGEFQVTYSSEAQDFQSFSQPGRRTVRWSQNQQNVTFPMALEDEYARYLADSLLMEAWASRSAHSFTVPYRYLVLDVGDVVTVTNEDGAKRDVRIIGVNMGLLAQIEITAVPDDPVIYYDPGLPAATPNTSGGVVVTFTPATLRVFETNAVDDSYAVGRYLGAAAGRPESGWGGGQWRSNIKIAKEGGNITDFLAQFDGNGILGEADTVLGVLPNDDGTSIYDVLDTKNTVRVTLDAGTLSSVTYDEMVAEGRNLAILGKEVFHFQTATLVSGKTYDLSNLIRFRRGTDYLQFHILRGTYAHTVGEEFVVIESHVETFPFAKAAVGQTREFRLIENGIDYSGGLPAFGDSRTLLGLTRKPYGPANVQYTGDRSGGAVDLDVSWQRRARMNGDLLDYADVPLDEDSESYRIDIMTSNLASVINSYNVSGLGNTDWTYTVAAQTNDGVEASAFAVVVYQISPAPGVGAGHPSRPLVIGLGPSPFE